MKFYEAMFIVSNDVAVKEPDRAKSLVEGVVGKAGGMIVRSNKWDERKLEYEIDGHRRGTYWLCYFNGPSTAPAVIEREVNISENLIRVLVLSKENEKQTILKKLAESDIVAAKKSVEPITRGVEIDVEDDVDD
ncbi:MAG: 30S ribosomal protein S6 [Planctomycetes bacterium]|nr:30S ribosomal protein S6 [Planctomycetota bacterium]